MTRMGCNHAGVKLAVSCPATTATRWLLYWPHVYSSAVYDVLLMQSLKNHMVEQAHVDSLPQDPHAGTGL